MFTHVTVLAQLNELMDPESGFLGREGLILRVDVLECCPWFEFADLETYTSGMAPHPSAIHHASATQQGPSLSFLTFRRQQGTGSHLW